MVKNPVYVLVRYDIRLEWHVHKLLYCSTVHMNQQTHTGKTKTTWNEMQQSKAEDANTNNAGKCDEEDDGKWWCREQMTRQEGQTEQR